MGRLAPGLGVRCGWPFRVRLSTSTAYCSLPMGHDGPLCRLLDQFGRTVAAAPRFGVQLDRPAR